MATPVVDAARPERIHADVAANLPGRAGRAHRLLRRSPRRAPAFRCRRRALTGADDQAQWLDETWPGSAWTALTLGVSIGGWAAVAAAPWRPVGIASVVLLIRR